MLERYYKRHSALPRKNRAERSAGKRSFEKPGSEEQKLPRRIAGYSRGVALIEIILALALLSVVIGSVLGVQWAIGDFSLNNARIVAASNIANDKLAGILLGGQFVDSQGSSTAPFAIVDSLSIWPFTKCEYAVNSETVWKTGLRDRATSTVSLMIGDFDIVAKYGKDCGGQPKRFSAGGFELLDAIELGFPTTHLDISGDYVFVSLRSPTESEPDLAVVPLNQPRSPVFLNIGPGINKIDVAGDYAFAAQHSSSSQLAIVDVSDDLNPEIIATSTLPGVAGSRPEAVSIFYFDSRVYVGTKRTAGREFHIFDVSDPATPVWLGSREVNHNVNEIAVKDGFAFLATSGNIRDLIVLDVRNPGDIIQVAAVDLPGNEDGRSVNVVGNLIFLGRHKGLSPGRDELQALEYKISPENGFVEINTVNSITAGADVSGIAYAGDYVFIATSHPQKELQVSGFWQKNSLVSAGEKDLSGGATGIDFENDVFAVSAGNELYLFKQE